MTVIYNEIEPYAADWLENLIAAGHIANGRVERRSIRDLQPGDLAGTTQAHFFAGIGVWSHALRLAGVPDHWPIWTGSCPSPSPSPARRAAPPTSAISGPPGTSSSTPNDLHSSLANRFQARTALLGSTMYSLTWKQVATPRGRLIWRLVASVPRTNETGCTSTPTPQASDASGGGGQAKRANAATPAGGRANLKDWALLSTVPSPTASLGDKAVRSRSGAITEAMRGHRPDLAAVAALTYCPTPTRRDGNASARSSYGGGAMKPGMTLVDSVRLSTVATPAASEPNGTPEQQTARKLKSQERGHSLGTAVTQLSLQAQLATVATPVVSDAHRGAFSTPGMDKKNGRGGQLPTQAQLATVTTPSARDWKDTSGMSETGVDPDGSTRTRLDQLPRQAQLAVSGATATGTTAETESIGQLDPAYSRWLMGLSPEWDACAPTGTRSSRRSRPSSSGP